MLNSPSVDFLSSNWGHKKSVIAPRWEYATTGGQLLNICNGWNLELERANPLGMSAELDEFYTGRRWYKEFFFHNEHHVCIQI